MSVITRWNLAAGPHVHCYSRWLACKQYKTSVAGVQAMGVVVTGPGRFDPALLPPMPAAPATANLDVTTLCALVSEVSNGDPRRPELQEWAQRVVHWRVGCKV